MPFSQSQPLSAPARATVLARETYIGSLIDAGFAEIEASLAGLEAAGAALDSGVPGDVDNFLESTLTDAIADIRSLMASGSNFALAKTGLSDAYNPRLTAE